MEKKGGFLQDGDRGASFEKERRRAEAGKREGGELIKGLCCGDKTER